MSIQVKPLLGRISGNFLNQYLEACGVTDVDKFLFPDSSCYDDPFAYPNMARGIERLNRAVSEGKRVGILCDCDVDGNLSATIIYKFLAQILGHTNLRVYFHVLKAHGLRKNEDEDLVPQIIEDGINLMIVPDAGSGDVQESAVLLDHNIDMIVLDHHLSNAKGHKGIVINNHLGPGLNTALSGTGVTDKFVRAYCSKYGVAYPHYEDLVASSLISDSCDLRTLENRAYLNDGFKLIENGTGNATLYAMAQTFNRRGNTPEGFSWGLIPPINALCRNDDVEMKREFFLALVGELPEEQGIKLARSAHKIQQSTVAEIVNEVSATVDDSHKVVVGFTEPVHKGYIGLAANKFCGSTYKPTLLLRENNPTTWSGSIRSPFPVATLINESKLAKCEGHEEACGIVVKKSQLKRLIKWFDELDIEQSPPVPVTAIIKPKDVTLGLCEACENNKQLWGASQSNGITIPTFYVEADINSDDITILGKNNNIFKFEVDGLTFIKFFCQKKEIEDLSSWCSRIRVSMIVTLETNTWDGKTTPQANISEYQIEPVISSNNWEDFF